MLAVYCECSLPWQRRQLQPECTTCTGGSAGWLLLLYGSLTLHGALRPYFRTKCFATHASVAYGAPAQNLILKA